jgi:dTDP-4-amino-4,6-dideoxygalactose transaminase
MINPSTKNENVACPVTDNVTKKVLCLPMFYKISEAEQNRFTDCLKRALDDLV